MWNKIQETKLLQKYKITKYQIKVKQTESCDLGISSFLINNQNQNQSLEYSLKKIV